MENLITEAFVTLVTNDAYVVGALVLGHSLRLSKTERHLACLVTSEVSQGRRDQLEDVFDHVIAVTSMDSGDAEHLALLRRPELGITFTKLHAFRLSQYEKCVFLDADTLVLQNVDELFEKDDFAAAPDVGWPDCFNSGVFVFKPSESTFKDLVELANSEGSFDGGDQGLLNQYFSSWQTNPNSRLSFLYNMTANTSYGYAPAFERFKDNIKIVHFAGASKPWQGIPAPSEENRNVVSLVQKWWDIQKDFMNHCSETASYKTVTRVRTTRSPGPDSDVTASPPRVSQQFVPSEHDSPLPPDAFLSSRSADEIVGRIAHLIATSPTSSDVADDDDDGDDGDTTVSGATPKSSLI